MVLALQHKAYLLDREAIIALAKVGFANRRKQLQRNLLDAEIFKLEQLKTVFSELGISLTARAQELSLEQWVGLDKQAGR